MGINSRSNCNCFGANSLDKETVPVRFAPGRFEAGHKTQCDRVRADGKDDRYGGRCLRRQRCSSAGGYDHPYAAADEIGCERRQPIELVLRITILDRHVLALIARKRSRSGIIQATPRFVWQKSDACRKVP